MIYNQVMEEMGAIPKLLYPILLGGCDLAMDLTTPELAFLLRPLSLAAIAGLGCFHFDAPLRQVGTRFVLHVEKAGIFWLKI
jgi:hypothetical protein